MHKNKLILILLALVLVGCGDNHKLWQENQRLSDALANQEAEAQEFIKQRNREASIAAACDVIIKVCPDAVANPGRATQKLGYGGGNDYVFWLAWAAKVFVIFCAPVIAFFTIKRSTLGKSVTKLKETEREIIEMVVNYENKESNKKSRLRELDQQANEKEKNINHLDDQASKIQEKIDSSTEELKLVLNKIEIAKSNEYLKKQLEASFNVKPKITSNDDL